MWGNAVAGIIDLFKRRAERKAAKAAGRAKVQAIRAGTAQEEVLTRAEWEAVSVRGLDTTWRDEWITILATSPVTLCLLGGIFDPVLMAFGVDYSLMDAGVRMMGVFTDNSVDYGVILLATVLAGLGLHYGGR